MAAASQNHGQARVKYLTWIEMNVFQEIARLQSSSERIILSTVLEAQARSETKTSPSVNVLWNLGLQIIWCSKQSLKLTTSGFSCTQALTEVTRSLMFTESEDLWFWLMVTVGLRQCVYVCVRAQARMSMFWPSDGQLISRGNFLSLALSPVHDAGCS